MRNVPILMAVLVLAACGQRDSGVETDLVGAAASKSVATKRAVRRAYDGAPPVVPHADLSLDCIACHGDQGIEVPGVGYAPPSPHRRTPGLSEEARCRQCHLFAATDELFRESHFAGMRQDLRRGERAGPLAPPVMPHPLFMREDCAACHDGAAVREEIRCSHPERSRCLQCHLQQVEVSHFR